MKLTLIAFTAFLSMAVSHAGTCTPHLNKVTRPFVTLKYENKDYPTEKSTLEECLQKTQDIFKTSYANLSKEDISNKANLSVNSQYTEANPYDSSKNATVLLSAFIPSGGDRITDKVFFPSSYRQSQKCYAYVQEKLTYLNGTFGNRGVVYLSPDLDGQRKLPLLSQCIALSAYSFLDSYQASDEASLVVNFSNFAMKGSERFYSVRLSTGKANSSLKEAFSGIIEKLRD